MKHVYNEEYAGWQLRTEHAVMTIVKTEPVGLALLVAGSVK